MESNPGMVTKEQLDESLERVMNNLLLEFGAVRSDIADVRSRLDRQAGLIQSGARAMLRIDRWGNHADNRIAEISDQIHALEDRVTRLEDRPQT